MASSLDRLDRAYEDAMKATGPAFFRRLGDYMQLIDQSRPIKRSVKQLTAEVEAAKDDYEREDEQLVGELVDLRSRFSEQVPEVGGSGEPRPSRFDPGDPDAARIYRAWTWTLGNFDAIAADRADKIKLIREGDDSRSRMLGEILNALIHDVIYPGDPNRPVRDDLDDLYSALNDIRSRQAAAQRRAEEIAESSGFLARVKIEKIMSYVEPKEPRPAAAQGSDEDLEWVNEVFLEGAAGFMHLREAMRPQELRGSLSREANEAVEGLKGDCQDALERMHRPIRRQLESAPGISGWSALNRGEKIAVLGIIVAVAIGVATIIAAG